MNELKEKVEQVLNKVRPDFTANGREVQLLGIQGEVIDIEIRPYSMALMLMLDAQLRLLVKNPANIHIH